MIDGVLYVTGWGGDAWAIDARSGRQIWRHRRTLPDDIRACCGPNNRGFGALGDRLFLGTADAHLLALDMRTGSVIWDAEVFNYKSGYSVTVAPLVVKDKVIVGVAGAEYGIRGFIDAYDIQTGKRVWRFYTVAGPDEPGGNTWPKGTDAYLRGGGSIWVTGTYDPEQNLVFYGTGNPGPDYFSAVREGDNLYTAAVVALDADTGKIRVALPVHAARCARLGLDASADPGRSHDRRTAAKDTALCQPQRLLLRDRSHERAHDSGEAICSADMGQEHQPRRTADPGAGHHADGGGSETCPDAGGGTNFYSPSYDPTTGLFILTARETCATYYSYNEPFKDGERYAGGGGVRLREHVNYGALRAIDPTTGDRKWEFRYPNVSSSGVLTTASGLVFAGDGDGNVMAFESKTGKNLWHYQLGVMLRSTGGTTYMVDGKQYFLVPSGSTLTAFALP